MQSPITIAENIPLILNIILFCFENFSLLRVIIVASCGNTIVFSPFSIFSFAICEIDVFSLRRIPKKNIDLLCACSILNLPTFQPCEKSSIEEIRVVDSREVTMLISKTKLNRLNRFIFINKYFMIIKIKLSKNNKFYAKENIFF